MTLLFFWVLIVLAVPLFVKGFLRHRRTWTPSAWRRFTGALVLSWAVVIVGLWLAQGVDFGLPFGGAFSLEDLPEIALFALTRLAICAPIFVLAWFAIGDSAAQFGHRQSSGGHSPNTR